MQTHNSNSICEFVRFVDIVSYDVYQYYGNGHRNGQYLKSSLTKDTINGIKQTVHWNIEKTKKTELLSL